METRGSRDWGWVLRAGSGVALLLAGLVVLSVGSAGLLTGLFRGAGAPVGTAQTAAFVIAALAPPLVLFFATRSLTDEPLLRKTATGGATLAGASAVLTGLGGGYAELAAGRPLATLLAAGYLIGTLVVVGALLGGVSSLEHSHRPSGAGVSWQATDRSGARSHSGAAPADGGSTESELSFPLDSDREDAEEDDRN